MSFIWNLRFIVIARSPDYLDVPPADGNLKEKSSYGHKGRKISPIIKFFTAFQKETSCIFFLRGNYVAKQLDNSSHRRHTELRCQ